VAKYEDYVKRLEAQNPPQDELDQEIEQAAVQTEERREDAGSNLPERFRNKSPEEIANSYVELEKAYSRQGQDIGALRKTVDELLTLQLQETRTREKPVDTKPVTVDDLYENADEAIRQVARKETDTRVQALEQELARERMEREQAKFTSKFPEWQNDVTNPEFIEWIRQKPHRVSMAQRADRGDFTAAEELFGTYYDFRDAAAKRKERESRKQQVRQVSLESPGAEVPEQTESFSRRKLMETRISAKKGNREAQQWLQDNAERIAIAYEERRIVD
jgi:hypothetical protein